VKVCQGQLYILYCDINSSFNGDEFWSFERLLQGDHAQIHTKWVMDYNTDLVEHLTFVLNGGKNGHIEMQFI
jgi:hypothetical protein